MYCTVYLELLVWARWLQQSEEELRFWMVTWWYSRTRWDPKRCYKMFSPRRFRADWDGVTSWRAWLIMFVCRICLPSPWRLGCYIGEGGRDYSGMLFTCSILCVTRMCFVLEEVCTYIHVYEYVRNYFTYFVKYAWLILAGLSFLGTYSYNDTIHAFRKPSRKFYFFIVVNDK